MLNAYKVRTYITVDDRPKIEVFGIGYGLTGGELPKVIKTKWSFRDCFDKRLPTPSVKTGTTFFGKRPYVEIEYSWCAVDRHYRFNNIIIERHYEPYDISLKELFEDYSAEDCVRYLKERGMSICHFNTTK